MWVEEDSGLVCDPLRPMQRSNVCGVEMFPARLEVVSDKCSEGLCAS